MLLVAAQACEPKAESAKLGSNVLNLENETARINYSLGYQIGGDFKRQKVELDADAVVQGIADALSDAEPKISEPEMHETLVALKRKIVADQRQQSAKRELELLEEGKRFLAENAKKPGVVTTESGLQYRIIEPGTGKHPGPTDRVTCRYTGRLIDGQEIDSSKDEPATFPLNGVIPGWAEGLQLIGEGGKIDLFVPQELAYGDRGPLGHRTVIYEIELLSVEDE
jgi:FKBP-type peptidyl-prolyl cis-trans isomerase FklB